MMFFECKRSDKKTSNKIYLTECDMLTLMNILKKRNKELYSLYREIFKEEEVMQSGKRKPNDR